MKITDTSNRITRIILGAMMLIVIVMGPLFLITQPTTFLECVLGWVFVAVFEVLAVWMWIRMPVIGGKS